MNVTTGILHFQSTQYKCIVIIWRHTALC